MRVLKRIGQILAIIIAGLIIVITLLLTVSPKPSASFFARAFNGTVKITNPKMYIRNQQNVKVLSSLAYGQQKDEKADIYRAKSNPSNKIVVWMHGGGFIGGDKSGMKEFATNLVGQTKVTFVALNYTVAPDGKYPTQVQQLAKGLRFVKENASQWGIDPSKMQIILGGDSAGAQIAAQYAALATNPNYAKIIPEVTLPVKQLAGTVLYCGPYDFRLFIDDNKANKSWLMKWFVHTIGWSMTGKFFWDKSTLVEQGSVPNKVTSAFPASYITDGNRFTFESSGKELVKQLDKHGVPVTARFFPKNEAVNHEYQFDFASQKAQITFEQTVKFIDALPQKN
ncbi:alpha/beta hydrolase [Periweissella fabalis]|uniref:Alpha/beta hydrolase n=1 Tax=Periweissella fabalis TaxID=1070421 RepID=A0A7X6N403_9LACO|nr:alpha/beta hydrolase [Periweissella fabalis]MCM0599663.1 alpha/beta hydrolase [Periweissella fabalis]NKZ24924.1 alpha/beta hydrolase [Periweissella fabalis]